MIMKCQSTIVKIRKCDDEKSIARWYKVEISKSRWLKLDIISCFHHRTFELSPSLYRYINVHHRTIDFFMIILSRFQHHSFVISTFHYRTIVFSPSYVRVFITVLSTFHYRTIAFLSDKRTHIIAYGLVEISKVDKGWIPDLSPIYYTL